MLARTHFSVGLFSSMPLCECVIYEKDSSVCGSPRLCRRRERRLIGARFGRRLRETIFGRARCLTLRHSLLLSVWVDPSAEHGGHVAPSTSERGERASSKANPRGGQRVVDGYHPTARLRFTRGLGLTRVNPNARAVGLGLYTILPSPILYEIY